METPNASVTLDECSVVSEFGQSQDTADKTLKETSGRSGLSSLTESCPGFVPASEVLVRQNGGVVDVSDIDVGMGNGGVAEASQAKGGSLESDFNEKMPSNPSGNGLFNDGVSFLEVGSAGNGNEDVGVESVGVESMEEVNGSHYHEVNAARKVEVSGDSISLFVEVFGPLNGFSEDDVNSSGEHVLSGDNSDQENLQEGESVLSLDNGEDRSVQISEIQDSLLDGTNNGTMDIETGGNAVKKEIIDSQECKFAAGDLAWIRTKTQSWWPVLICDPSIVSKDDANFDQVDHLLVKYFGNGNLLWCSPSRLKPFIKYFEEMLKHSNSKSFIGAVEKAVGEIGRRLKMEMTCSCLSKENQNTLASFLAGGTKEGVSMTEDKLGQLGEFSVAHFEPTTFLAFVKCLAQDVSLPGMIELVVNQSRLSAFYRAMGHCQLPMHQLRPATDAKDNSEDKVPIGKAPKQDDKILTKLSGRDRNVGLLKCGNNVADKGNDLASTSRKNSCEGAEDFYACKLASSEVEMVSLSTSPRTIEREVSCLGNDDEGTEEKSEKNHELRERKRSKYLSSPYVNLNRGHKDSSILGENGMEDVKEGSHVGMNTNNTAGQSMGSTLLSRSSGKKSRKKWSRKPITLYDISRKLEGIPASSVELLSELRCTALDVLYPNKSRFFDSVEIFLSGFRSIEFCNEFDSAMSHKGMIDHQESNNEMHVLQNLTDVGVENEKGKGMEEVSEQGSFKFASGSPDMNKTAAYPGTTGEVVTETIHCSPNVVHKRRRRKKKEERAPVSLKANPVAGPSEIDRSITTSRSVIIDFQKMSYIAPEVKSVPKKKKQGTTPEVPQINFMPGLPDLNGNSASFLTENSHVTGPAAPKKGKRKEGTVSESSKTRNIGGMAHVNRHSSKRFPMSKDLQITVPDMLETISKLSNGEGKMEAALMHVNTGTTAHQPDANENNMEASTELQKMGLLFPGGKPEHKKRKRKEKTSNSPKTEVTLSIPDLNGNATFAETNSTITEGQSQIRKKNKAATGVPSLNVNLNNMQTNGEASEAALLLKFSPGYSVPSKETLVAAFCGSGSLKESDTQIMNDGSAQVVFMRSSDAENALRSLEKCSPFGPTLVSFQLRHLSAALRTSEPDNYLQTSQSCQPIDGHKTPAKPSRLKPQEGEPPDLSYIRQNLEMMTSMLEKAGDNLSPEMRIKLDSEIKGLLSKVSNMIGSSSS